MGHTAVEARRQQCSNTLTSVHNAARHSWTRQSIRLSATAHEDDSLDSEDLDDVSEDEDLELEPDPDDDDSLAPASLPLSAGSSSQSKASSTAAAELPPGTNCKQDSFAQFLLSGMCLVLFYLPTLQLSACTLRALPPRTDSSPAAIKTQRRHILPQTPQRQLQNPKDVC